MALDRIPQNLNAFQVERAFELLKLVQKAHERYDASRRGKSITQSKIQIDNCINEAKQECYSKYESLNNSSYEILADLVFTQIDWLSVKTFFRKKYSFGFIARKTETSDIYVVFRGTANLGEWINNFKFIQQSYKTVRDSDLPGETHWGFRRTYDRPEDEKRTALWITRLLDKIFLNGACSIREIVETTLKKACPLNASKSRIFVTGHSLGGALATLATAHITKLVDDNKISAALPVLYTFASPRVGDSIFAASFKQNLECYRIANSEDLVPKIPIPTLLLVAGRTPPKSGTLSLARWLNSGVDYEHVGVPIYFTAQKETISDNHTIPIYLDALRPS